MWLLENVKAYLWFTRYFFRATQLGNLQAHSFAHVLIHHTTIICLVTYHHLIKISPVTLPYPPGPSAFLHSPTEHQPWKTLALLPACPYRCTETAILDVTCDLQLAIFSPPLTHLTLWSLPPPFFTWFPGHRALFRFFSCANSSMFPSFLWYFAPGWC